MTHRANYRIHGLDCAEEVAILKKQVGGKAGIIDLSFDILSARMTVTYDAERIQPAEIVSAVAAAGMSAIPWEERLAEPTPASFWLRNRQSIFVAASGGFLLAAFVAHWILHKDFADALLGGELGSEQHAHPPVVIALYLAAVAAGAWIVLPKAWQALRHLRPDMNLLMIIAVAGAIAIGQWFEAATVSFLFSLALLMEQWSIGKARRAIGKALDITPRTARTVCPHDGDLTERRVEDVKIGEVILVRPGERIPLDGEVASGNSAVNQAPITGESVPVEKGPGDEVFAGTINENGSLQIRVSKAAQDTMLARMIHMVQEAQGRRAPSQRWVDQFAFYYTPLVMILAAAVVLVPPVFLELPWPDWIYRGLVVLVISCPCALVISTPVTIVSALASAAHNGVLIKGGMYLEAAAGIEALCLDKTGTLTHGYPEVQSIIPLNGHTRERLLQKAAALEAHSHHPLARAIVRKAKEEGIEPQDVVSDFTAIQGKGAEASFNGRAFWIGSHRFMEEKGENSPETHRIAVELEDAGHSVVAVGNDQHVCGLISVADGVRPEANEMIRQIKEQGIKRVVMLTGDNEGTARAVAEATGVDAFHCELLPQDKVEAVGALVRRFEKVAMVGDGVNDAPAMAAATFGIAMGAMGSDAAIETADIALMSDELHKIPWLIAHARRAFRIVRQNIIFALGLKFLFLVLAVFGLATLWMAVAADMGASLLVIFNGLRLLKIDNSRFI